MKRIVVAILLISLVSAALMTLTRMGTFKRASAGQTGSALSPGQRETETMSQEEANAVLKDWTFPGSRDETVHGERNRLAPLGLAGRIGLSYRVLIATAPFSEINRFYNEKYRSGPSPSLPDQPISVQTSGILPSKAPSSRVSNGVTIQTCGYARSTSRYTVFASISSLEDGKRTRIILTFAPMRPIMAGQPGLSAPAAR